MTINQLPELTSHDGNVVVPASYNGADYKLPIGNMLLKKSVTTTTGADGNAGGILLEYSNWIVLAIVRTDSTSVCHPIVNVTTGQWVVNVRNSSNSAAITNTSINLDVYYIPRPSA